MAQASFDDRRPRPQDDGHDDRRQRGVLRPARLDRRRRRLRLLAAQRLRGRRQRLRHVRSVERRHGAQEDRPRHLGQGRRRLRPDLGHGLPACRRRRPATRPSSRPRTSSRCCGPRSPGSWPAAARRSARRRSSTRSCRPPTASRRPSPTRRLAGDHGVAAIQRAADVAVKAAEDTKSMLAMRGRAAYTGERSIGSVDAGATAIGVILQAIAPHGARSTETREKRREEVPERPEDSSSPSSSRASRSRATARSSTSRSTT